MSEDLRPLKKHSGRAFPINNVHPLITYLVSPLNAPGCIVTRRLPAKLRDSNLFIPLNIFAGREVSERLLKVRRTIAVNVRVNKLTNTHPVWKSTPTGLIDQGV